MQANVSYVLQKTKSLKSAQSLYIRKTTLYLLVPPSYRRESERPESGEKRRYSSYVLVQLGKQTEIISVAPVVCVMKL